MPVNTSYSWGISSNISLASGQSNVAVAPLATGGFVAVNDDGTDIDGFIFGNNEANWIGSPGTNGDITQLDNGNLLLTYEDADSYVFEIRDTDGLLIVGPTDLDDSDTTNVAVTAVAGGFVIAYQDRFSPTVVDIDVDYFDNAGALQEATSPGFNFREETNAALATLNNGNVVVAWQDAYNADVTAVEFEIWSPDGSSRISAEDVVVDNIGINQNVSLTALSNGGFAMVYEDNDFREGGTTLVTFDSTGTEVGRFDISGDGGIERNPELVTLSNGLLALAVTSESFFLSSQTTTLLRLIDPATGEVIADDRSIFDGGSNFDPLEDPAIAALIGGQVVVLHENSGDGVTEGEVLQAVRHTTGDDTSNIVFGDQLVDVMTGGVAADFFYGQGSDDFMFGGGGADWLYGDDGDDTLDGDAGADLLFGVNGNDSINGGDDGDFIYGGSGEDILFGEAGDDWIYGESENDVIFGHAGADSLFGGTGDDQIYGGLETDSIFGEAGNDTIYGGEGGDVISGQDGNDQIYGGEGGDFLFGGDDFDTIRGGTGNDQIFGQGFNDLLYGDEGDDFIDGGDLGDIIYGGDGSDSIFGQEGFDRLHGGEGGDVINGGTEDDSLFGDAGGDFLFGDAGVDVLDGGTGNDQLYGGSNGIVIPGEVDTFVFDANTNWGNDTIHDFEDGVDLIRFIASDTLDEFGDLTVTNTGGDAVLTFGVDSVTILGASGLVSSDDVDFIL